MRPNNIKMLYFVLKILLAARASHKSELKLFYRGAALRFAYDRTEIGPQKINKSSVLFEEPFGSDFIVFPQDFFKSFH
jgi:hypothetical protein